MYAFNDLEFMAGQAFPGMPPGMNPDFDGWLKSGGAIRTRRIRLKRVARAKYNHPDYTRSRHDLDRMESARADFIGCAFAKPH